METKYQYLGWTVKLTRKGAAWTFDLIRRNGANTGGGFAPNEEVARRYAEEMIDDEIYSQEAAAERRFGC